MGKGGGSLVSALGQGQLLGEKGTRSPYDKDGRPSCVSVTESLALNRKNCLGR